MPDKLECKTLLKNNLYSIFPVNILNCKCICIQISLNIICCESHEYVVERKQRSGEVFIKTICLIQFMAVFTMF